jgi:prepilin-type N-terminal cleavage/methylation domain-containing protein
MTGSARQRGFTVIEALIGITILSIVTLVMASTFLVGVRAISNEARIIAADNASSDASLSLVRDLNSANALPGGPVTISSASSLTLQYGSPPAVTVVYSVDANANLIRTVGVAAQVAARGITSVVIAPAGCYVTVTIQPSAVGATASTLNVSNRPGGCF